MFRKFLIFIICIAVFTCLTGCGTVGSLFGRKDTVNKNGEVNNTGDMADIMVSEDDPGNDTGLVIPESEYPLLLMRIHANTGMDESYDVLELTENMITYSYYDFSDPENPVLKQKTVPFEEMLEQQNGIDKYYITLYLYDGTNEYELELTADLEEKIRKYPEFRETLGSVLGKPFNSAPRGFVISTEDINVTAQRNTGTAQKEEDSDEAADEGDEEKIRLSELDNGYEISAVFHNGTEGLMKYSIEYPQISGLDDEAIQNRINDTIRDEVLKVLAYCEASPLPADGSQLPVGGSDAQADGSLSPEEESAPVEEGSDPLREVRINYKIARRTPALLSIQYYGSSGTADMPGLYDLYFTTSINIRTGNRVRLKDIVEISDSFVNRFLDGTFKVFGQYQAESLGQLDRGTLKGLFEEADLTDNMSLSEKPRVFSSFMMDSLDITIDLGNDAGIAFYEIRYADMEEYMIVEDHIRQELLSTGIAVVTVLQRIDFENLGTMKLTAGIYENNGIMKLRLLLDDWSRSILHVLPEFTDIPWYFEGLAALDVVDADADGLRDIVVIAYYITGTGASGAVPFPVAHIYFQSQQGFLRDIELEQRINEEEFASVEDVIGLIEKYKAG